MRKFLFVLSVLLISGLVFGQDQALLPKELQIDDQMLQQIFKRGESDAEKTRSVDGALNVFRRGIGDIRTAPLRTETVSFLWLNIPEMYAYSQGFESRKKYYSDEEKAKVLSEMNAEMAGGRKHIWFSGVLNIFPSFGGYAGRIDRLANADDLKGVRVVLKIGDRIYQPTAQPGDLEYKSAVADNTVATPNVDTTTVNGPLGSATITNYYTTIQTQSFDYFADFSA